MIEPAPLRAGSITNYTIEHDQWGTFEREYWVNESAGSLDASGREVLTIPITRVSDLGNETLYVSQETGVVEALREECAYWTRPSTAAPWECADFEKIEWLDVQGSPAALSASVVQGRTFSIGDSWTVQGDCHACLGPFEVSIEGPTGQSPTGTVYTVLLDVRFHQGILALDSPAGRLHMGLGHAWPLLVETDDMKASLNWHVPGDDPHEVRSPPAASLHDGLLAPVAYEDGLPVEGEPIRDLPSWAQARAQTGAEAPPSDAAVLLSAFYKVDVGHLLAAAGEDVGEQRSYRIETTYATDQPGRSDFEYEREDRYRGVPVLEDRGEWSVDRTDRHGEPVNGCDASSVPIWAAARAAEELELVPEITGFWYFDQSETPCQDYNLRIYGPWHTVGSGPIQESAPEYIGFDAASGLLEDATLWTGE